MAALTVECVSNITLKVAVYEYEKFVCRWIFTYNDIKCEHGCCGNNFCDIYVSMTPQIWYTFLTVLQTSVKYRRSVLNNCHKYVKRCTMSAIVWVNKDGRDVFNYLWNYLMLKLIHERMILDTVMSYLSTLGGAFSSLGDDFPHCAVRAGQISRKQFQIALRLKEEPLIARCRLYLALSLIQQEKFKFAKSIILQQYTLAKEIKDVKLENMSKGIWSKLQYYRKKAKLYIS